MYWVAKAWYKNIMKYSTKKAFTLVEMLIVVAIIAIIAAGSIMTSRSFRDQVLFASNFQNVEGLISEARNRSLTGESFEDTNDYDGDGLTSDLILPNGYIVRLQTIDDLVTVSLWADLFDSNVGQFDELDDYLLKSYVLDDSIRIETFTKRKTGGSASIDPLDFTFIYTTPEADFELINEPDTSLELKISQLGSDGEEIRSKYIFMHYLFGIPELLNESYINPDLQPPSLL